MGLFFAALGLPGLCGFPGEVFVVLSVWKFSYVMAILAAAVVVLTAGYILWAVQRVYLGASYRGRHEDEHHITPSTFRENLIGSVLLFFAIWFGVFPGSLLKYMDATIDQQVKDLAAWTERVQKDEPPPAEGAATQHAGASPLRGPTGAPVSAAHMSEL
jgi:NADH-quinone oxidoreductase subunit M